MKSYFKDKTVKIVSLALCGVLAASAVILSSRTVAKAVEYNEQNPSLTYAIIDSDVEKKYNVDTYTPYGKYTENIASGTYTMETDGYVVWDKSDDFYFGYRRYDIGSKSSDTLTATVDLTSFTAIPGCGKYYTASCGLMIRAGLEADAPSILLHVREGAIGVLNRKEKGDGTNYTASGATPTDVTGLRIVKKGDKYECFYKISGLDWISFKTVKMASDGPFYAGLALHCSDKKNPVIGTFKNLSVVGSGEYVDNPSGGDDSSDSNDEYKDLPEWEDAPIPDNCLFYETFTDPYIAKRDGKTVDKPKWKYYNGKVTVSEDGNRESYYPMIAATDIFGGTKWTDYRTSLDFRVTKDTDPSENDSFTLRVRNKAIETTGYTGYNIKISSTYNVSDKTTKCYVEVSRQFRTITDKLIAKSEIPSYLDYKSHNLAVEVIDNRIKVFYDLKPIIFTVNSQQVTELTDDSEMVIGYGNVALTMTDSIDVYFDNIIVTKLDDPIGGDYDNFIGGNWNENVPDYAQDFADKYNKELY